jgi:hypothetical protein
MVVPKNYLQGIDMDTNIATENDTDTNMIWKETLNMDNFDR